MIIPVFNAKPFLQRCLDSVFAQTHRNLEVIAVNDGSHDGSQRVLERNAAADPRLRIIDQENQGQGIARNRALEDARGDFILFLDADDFLEPLTLELTVARAKADDSDFVHFDWKLASALRHRSKAFNYFNVRNIWRRRTLEGPECDELMDTVSFFSVTSLYRKSFLDHHGLRFGEGYIYEDNPFYVLAANRATRVSLIHSPLYVIQPNQASTTQMLRQTDRHAIGHIRAIRETLPKLQNRSAHTLTYFAKYHLQKFMEYSASRVPPQHRAQYSHDFVEAFSAFPIELAADVPVNHYLRTFVRHGVFTKHRHRLFHSVITLRNRTAPKVKRRLNDLKKRRNLRLQQREARARRKALALVSSAVEQADMKLEGAFLFYGFDHRYAGNSRALFEILENDSRFAAHPRLFITEDERVNPAQRIDPTDHALVRKALAKASIVFLESWVPPKLPKHPDSIWIQLWHGTPFKRVLFDSHESRIISARAEHKVVKHRDIQKWDYLLADSDAAREKFSSAFLFPASRILQTGYPRVRFLLDHRDDEALKQSIRSTIQVPDGKQVVLYAPTWRDHNYGLPTEEQDHSYELAPSALADVLGEDYFVISHGHDYLGGGGHSAHERCIDASSFDIQDLLLISDAVVSDYSSVVFDCFASGIPVALYCADPEQFEAERGLYPDMWRDFAPLVTETAEGAADLIRHQPTVLQDQAFLDRYAYKPQIDLLDFLDELDLYRLNRNW
ncbi:hypothetical protein BMH30_00780 [Leucobacter sp. OLES1]|nr:hypothetical protein BMH30_00780 [Leucobacter sp. OLES1]